MFTAKLPDIKTGCCTKNRSTPKRADHESKNRIVDKTTEDYRTKQRQPYKKVIRHKDPRLWTKEELEDHIKDLIQKRNEHENNMKIQEEKHSELKELIEDTEQFGLDDRKERFNLRMDILRVAKLIEESKEELNEAIAGYDSEKIITELEIAVSKNLKQQLRKLNTRYERLMEKEKLTGVDQILVDSFNDSKFEYEIEKERNKRLKWKMIGFRQKEIIKSKNALLKVSDKRSECADVTIETEAVQYNNNNKRVKLPSINAEDVICDIELLDCVPMNVSGRQIEHRIMAPHSQSKRNNTVRPEEQLQQLPNIQQDYRVSHPSNATSNGTTAIPNLPHPPNATSNGTTAIPNLPRPPKATSNNMTPIPNLPCPPNATSNGTTSIPNLPRPLNATSNSTTSIQNLPRPPNKEYDNGKRFVRKYKNSVN